MKTSTKLKLTYFSALNPTPERTPRSIYTPRSGNLEFINSCHFKLADAGCCIFAANDHKYHKLRYESYHIANFAVKCKIMIFFI